MRVTVAVFGLMLVSIAPAVASSSAANCRTGPPKEWNQPRVTYTYSGSTSASGYGPSRTSSSYSARSSTSRSAGWRPFRDPFGR